MVVDLDYNWRCDSRHVPNSMRRASRKVVMVQWAIFWRYADQPHEEWLYQTTVFAGDPLSAVRQYQADKLAKQTGEIMIIQLTLSHAVYKLPLKR
jgi:hypothetical protein